MQIDLFHLEKLAAEEGLLLRIQVRRPLNIWALKVVVAQYFQSDKVKIWGEMKAWAYEGKSGLQLDTMRVNPLAPKGVAHLIWAATMSWALENTSCKNARLLAIRDDEKQHSRLVKYFLRRGFRKTREVGSAPIDLPLRLIWGGSGELMIADCNEVLNQSYKLWKLSAKSY